MRQNKTKLVLMTFGSTIIVKQGRKEMNPHTLSGVTPSPALETPEQAIKALLNFVNRELGTHYALTVQTNDEIVKEMTA